MSSHKHYESLANRWNEQGRPAELLLDGYALIALRCWSWSEGGKREGMSELLQAFLRASEDVLPEDWIDDYLYNRETCRICGETYKLENMKLCTQCSRTCCYRCSAQAEKALDGNPVCPCGGELVG